MESNAMILEINNNAKKDKADRTSMSQQALVNALLSEKQPTNPGQPANNAVQPVTEWGGK